MTDSAKYAEAERYARSRMQGIQKAVEAAHDDPDAEAVSDIPLDVEILGNRERDKYHVTVLLGTGGPHDELRYTVWGGNVDTVEYFYADWGYGTLVPLSYAETVDATDFLNALMPLDCLDEYCGFAR